MTTKNGHVSIVSNERLAVVSFFHPAHNALPGYLLEQLSQAILKCGLDKNIQIILLKSEGDRTFCAGASFDELISITDFPTGHQFFMGFAKVINAIRTCGKIVVGRIQGKAVGGGVGLASAVDYAIATKYASVRLSELAVGIGPFVVGPAVERKVGTAAFTHLSLSPAEWKTAQWAKDNHLYAEAFDSTEQMDEYIDHFIGQLLSYNPIALQRIKEVSWSGTEHWSTLLDQRAAISGELILSPHAKAAINAFKNKG